MSNEKPKLDYARRLRGIYFLVPEDKEFKETIRNACKKLETPMLQLCLARQARRISVVRPVVRPMKSKQNFRNLQDCVWENHSQIIMRTMLQEKETIHYSFTIWYTIFPMPQAMKIRAAKAAVDKEWEKLEKFSSWNLTESLK